MAALRKHIKILEDRLRNERHTHAVKFSEVERQMIQENAKLKVSTNALQRQVKREQQLVQDHETELAKLKKDRKGKFSLSGLARSFSDAKLEDMEMKDRSGSLKREEPDYEPEVVEMLKQRLDDSEKDRLEGEALFNQRISGLLRERNLQRADMREAEETILRLTSENEAFQKTIEEMRAHLTSNQSSPIGDPSDYLDQISALNRANKRLRNELSLLSSEKVKLISDLEVLSEELTLSKANEKQSQDQSNIASEMKNRIDKSRNQLASLERRKISVSNTHGQNLDRETSFSTESINSVISMDHRPGPSNSNRDSGLQQKVVQLENQLKMKQQELTDCLRKLNGILDLSQRYELHCYQLEKQLFEVYGKNYKFENTEWRKNDTKLIKALKTSVQPKLQETLQATSLRKLPSTSAMTQTTLPQHHSIATVQKDDMLQKLTEKVNSMIRMLEQLSAKQSPISSKTLNADGKAVSAAFDDLLRAIREGHSSNSLDVTRLTEAKLEIQALQRGFRALEEKNVELDTELQRLRTEKSYENEFSEIERESPITQAEIDERIARAQLRAQQLQAAGLLQNVPVFGATNPFVTAETTTNYTSQTSGIWVSPWSSGSSKNERVDPFYTAKPRPRAASFF